MLATISRVGRSTQSAVMPPNRALLSTAQVHHSGEHSPTVAGGVNINIEEERRFRLCISVEIY